MSDALHRATCRGCGRPVLFALDEKGTQQILDARAPVFLVDIYTPAEPNRVARCAAGYVSHFATCPAAEHFSQTTRCECGHTQSDHSDGACAYDTCVCPGFHEAQRFPRKDPTP